MSGAELGYWDGAAQAALLRQRAAEARDLMGAEGLDALVVPSRGHVTQYGDVEFLTGYTPVARMAYAVITRSGRGPVLIAPTPADRWFASRQAQPPEIRVPAALMYWGPVANEMYFQARSALLEFVGIASAHDQSQPEAFVFSTGASA